MWSIIWGILSSGSSILYGLLAAAAAVVGALALGKSQGRREERDRIKIQSLEEKYETAVQRQKTDTRVRGLSDAELDRLQLQYELDSSEPAGHLRGVASDSSDEESGGQGDKPSPKGANKRS